VTAIAFVFLLVSSGPDYGACATAPGAAKDAPAAAKGAPAATKGAPATAKVAPAVDNASKAAAKTGVAAPGVPKVTPAAANVTKAAAKSGAAAPGAAKVTPSAANVSKAAAKPGAASPGAANDAPDEAYKTKGAAKPDPFRPFVEKEVVLKKQIEKAPPSSIYPLQKVGLDQFTLVGIAGDAKRRMAIVETKDNKGRFYPLTLGTIIGLNKGKVVEIRSDRVVVEEATPGVKGRKINKIIIKLHKEEEGAP